MSNKYRKAVVFTSIPAIINLSISYFFYHSKGQPEYYGYLAGACVSILLSLLWLIQLNIGIKTGTKIFLSIFLGGFSLRLVVFIFCALGGYYIFNFNMLYFAVAFLVGSVINIIIEVWLCASLYRPEKVK